MVAVLDGGGGGGFQVLVSWNLSAPQEERLLLILVDIVVFPQ